MTRVLSFGFVGLALLMLIGCGGKPEPERAALDADAALTKIVFASCFDQNQEPDILTTIRRAEPDLMIWMGDNVYADSKDALGRYRFGPEELEAAYAALGELEPFRKLQAAVPFLATWDDHDYGRNDAGAEYTYKEHAQRRFAQFWDVPKDDPRRTKGHGVYHSVTVGPEGQRVQIILLDTRYFRSPLTPTDQRGAKGKERYVPDPDPEKTVLGAEQWKWLGEELKKPAELRLVVSSIQLLAEGHGWERWGNLPAERQRFLDLVRDTGAGRVVVLSGDRHIGNFYADESLAYPLYEATSSSLNRPFTSNTEVLPNQLQPVYGEANFGVISIDWPTQTLTVDLRDAKGKVARQLVLSLDQLGAAGAPPEMPERKELPPSTKPPEKTNT